MKIEEKILQLRKDKKPFVVATVVRLQGSVPGKVGFKMVIEKDSKTIGTVGGGGIENRVVEESLKRLTSGESVLKEYVLSDKKIESTVEVEVVPMMCNGKVWIFYEIFREHPTVYVFGGGHVGQALLSILSNLDYNTVLIDNRAEFANREVNPNASVCINNDYIEYAKTFEPNSNSFVVILTHGHEYDYGIAKTIYERGIDLSYVGVIGSKTKASEIKEKLINELGSDIDLSNLHSPIGLNIGGDSASEIALSIAAQIQSVRYKKS